MKRTDKKIKWAVKQVINTDESTAVVATISEVSRRRIQQLARRYKETGEYLCLMLKEGHGSSLALRSGGLALF